MKNSKARSTILPPLRLTNHQMFNRKDELIRDEKIEDDPLETLPCIVNKLSICESTKANITSKLIQEATAQKDITEHDLKKIISLYDIDEMSSEELYASLRRIAESPQQPFSFLANISNEFTDSNQSSIETGKSTEIDIQLAAVAKRIESTKILLNKAKSYIEDIRLCAEQNNVYQSSETINDYYDDKIKVEKDERSS